MKSCCVERGHNYFASLYPLAGSVQEDFLAHHLIDLCKKWGKITSRVVDDIYLRSASSLRLGVNAKTGAIRCNVCGGRLDYIFIGSRLISFIWRLNMICATYWDVFQKSDSNKMVGMTGSTQWPREEQLEQVRIALEMYFGDAPLLGTEGLEDFNKQMAGLALGPAAVHTCVVDFAELFVLFHEIQHHIPLATLGPKPIGLSVQLPPDLKISPKRGNWWITELNNDSNSMYLLLLSAASVFVEKCGMTTSEAKTQSASLVCAGADAALQTLQTLEELRYGKVTAEAAATSADFVRHPPSAMRRNALSLGSYSLVTGKPSDSLLGRELTDEWKMVARNVASHMKVQDYLFAAYRSWHKKAE